MVQLNKWFLCFTLFVFILINSSSLTWAVETENRQMIRVRENLAELLDQPLQEEPTLKIKICNIVRGLYTFINNVPYQISLKNLLTTKNCTDGTEVKKIEQKKKDNFLAMTWVILHQAGFDLEKKENSILIKGRATDITLSTGPTKIQPENKKPLLDVCIQYPRSPQTNDPLGYDYTFSLTHLVGNKRGRQSDEASYEKISSREGNLSDQLHGLVSGKDDEITHFEDLLSRVFSSVPEAWRVDREAYYHSLLHIFFTLNNINVVSESCSSNGRIDSYVQIGENTDQKTIIFEFKRKDSTGLAAKQVMKTEYHSKLLLDPINPKNDVYFVGCRFQEKRRGSTKLEPTCWPFKCSNTGDDIEIKSLRGTETERKEHTYSSKDIQQMDSKKSLGDTPKKQKPPRATSIQTSVVELSPE